jgi:mannitol-specific phosphotransferase system IIBC component
MAPWAGKGAGRRHNNDAGGQNQQAQQSRRQQEQQVVVAAGLSGSKMGVDQHRQQVSEADVKAVGELALTKLQQDLQRRQQQDGQQVASS